MNYNCVKCICTRKEFADYVDKYLRNEISLVEMADAVGLEGETCRNRIKQYAKNGFQVEDRWFFEGVE